MKNIIFSALLFSAGCAALAGNAYAGSAARAEVKKTDDGVRITVLSDDPALVREIQAEARYYADTWTYDDYCGYMGIENELNYDADVKVAVSKVEKGIQAAITSKDPQVIAALQEDSRHYRDIWGCDDYWRHMWFMSGRQEHMCGHRRVSGHSCCDWW